MTANREVTPEQLEKLVESLTDEQYVALSVLKDNIFNGANWGIVTGDLKAELEKDYAKVVELGLKGQNGFKFTRLRILNEGKKLTGYLVEVSTELISSVLAKVFTPEEIKQKGEEFKKYRQEALGSLEKKFSKLSGKGKISFGVYSVNRSHKVTVNTGKGSEKLDAYQLTFGEVLKAISRATSEKGKHFTLGVSTVVSASQPFVSFLDLMHGFGQNPSEGYIVETSADHNAILITVAYQQGA